MPVVAPVVAAAAAVPVNQSEMLELASTSDRRSSLPAAPRDYEPSADGEEGSSAAGAAVGSAHTPASPTRSALLCIGRGGVSREEAVYVERMGSDPALSSGAVPFDGLLTLGVAREILLTPAHEERKRKSEEIRLQELFKDAIRWREETGARRIRERGLPAHLVEGRAQSEAQLYGSTVGGLPVVVDLGSEWRRAITAARQLGLPPEDFALTRVFWHERCLETACRAHAAGRGNGQFIHVIDFGGMRDLGVSECRAGFSYIKRSIVDISLNYAGTCKRIYVARPSKIFYAFWTLAKPWLPDKTKRKIVVLPSRARQRLEDYGDDPLVAMTLSSVPAQLGGAEDVHPTEPMYCQKGAPPPPAQRVAQHGAADVACVAEGSHQA